LNLVQPNPIAAAYRVNSSIGRAGIDDEYLEGELDTLGKA